MRRHIRTATLLAAQLLGDRDDAEDVVQEAFTVVHRNARGFDGERPFGPWLFGIVRRLAANRKARDARRARLLRLWGRESLAPAELPRADYALLAGGDSAAAAAQLAMAELSPMQRACFELVSLRELPVEEVAAMHGVSASTVRQHVFRARTALRKLLGVP